MSNHAGLHLTFDGIATPAGCGQPLDAGQLCEFQTGSSFQVSGDQPFLVMQFMLSQGPSSSSCEINPTTPDCMGDPASVIEATLLCARIAARKHSHHPQPTR